MPESGTGESKSHSPVWTGTRVNPSVWKSESKPNTWSMPRSAASTPEDSTWSGTPGGDGTTYDTGYVYEYTFEVAGEYEYYCAPHRSLGMTGSFTVE